PNAAELLKYFSAPFCIPVLPLSALRRFSRLVPRLLRLHPVVEAVDKICRLCRNGLVHFGHSLLKRYSCPCGELASMNTCCRALALGCAALHQRVDLAEFHRVQIGHAA